MFLCQSTALTNHRSTSLPQLILSAASQNARKKTIKWHPVHEICEAAHQRPIKADCREQAMSAKRRMSLSA